MARKICGFLPGRKEMKAKVRNDHEQIILRDGDIPSMIWRTEDSLPTFVPLKLAEDEGLLRRHWTSDGGSGVSSMVSEHSKPASVRG